MAYAIDTYTGNASTTTFNVTFPYISTTDVVVTLDGVTQTITTDYTFATSSTIQFVSAPASAVTIKFIRSSNRTARLVDYQDGSTITENILDQDSNQLFYMAQEALDITDSNIGLSLSTDQWDADSKRITNVANPTANQDAVTKYYLENTWLSTSDKANITTLAGISGLATLAGITSDVTAVAADATDIGAVAAKATEIGRLGTADAVADMALLGTVDCVADMAQLASTATIADLAMLAETDIVADLAQLATTDFVSDLNAIEAVKANVTTVADNIAGVNSFADRYRVGTTNPASSLDEGDLFYNSTDNTLKYYNGTGWASITAGIGSMADDTTPELGGDLSLNSNDITGTGNIAITGYVNARQNWESKDNDFTAEAGKAYLCDTSSNDIDVTLPTGTVGDTLRFLDVTGSFDTNDLTILYGSSKIQGASANLDVATERAGFTLVYYNATQGWILTEK